MIGSARSAAFRTPEGRRKAASELMKRNIDSLIVIGGDGSLTGADIFRQEWPEHVKVTFRRNTSQFIVTVTIKALAAENPGANPFLRIVGLVGSIDNDMWYEQLCCCVRASLTWAAARTIPLAPTVRCIASLKLWMPF